MVDLTEDVGSWVGPTQSRRTTPGWAWAVMVLLVIALAAASAYLAAGLTKAKPLPLTASAATLTGNVNTLNQQVTELNALLSTVIIGNETFSDSLSAASPQLQAAIDAAQIKLATIDDTIRTILPAVRTEAGDTSAHGLQKAQKTLTDKRADLSAQLAANLTAVKASLERTQLDLQSQIDALTKVLKKSNRHIGFQIKGLQGKGSVKQITKLTHQVHTLTAEHQKLVSQIEALQTQVKNQQQEIEALQQAPAPQTSPTAGTR